jgi:hypothetical protein
MATIPAPEPGRRPIAGRVCTAAGSLAAEGAAGYWHPALGAALAAADVIVPAVFALILLTVILFGSTETCERAFRLLRWIAGRAAPPPPPGGAHGRAAVQRAGSSAGIERPAGGRRQLHGAGR